MKTIRTEPLVPGVWLISESRYLKLQSRVSVTILAYKHKASKAGNLFSSWYFIGKEYSARELKEKLKSRRQYYRTLMN